jgi:predicted CxxxxCH...CXXCH cytochrome family protein
MSKHTTGTIVFVPHPSTWMSQSDPGFHAFSANKGLANCQACHGQKLDGGYANVACAQCHTAGGIASDFATCTGCHGGTDNPTGAPPRATWGNSADTVRIGAHTAHVTASAISPAFDCALCHVKPADMFAAGHIDGPTATVTFNGMSIGTSAPAPTWDRPTATCASTYCHGNFRNGNATNAPVWNRANQALCGSCHGLPPSAAAHPAVGSDLTVCSACHPKTMYGDGTIIPPSLGGLHLDGLIEASGHDASWMDPSSSNFHAFSAVRGLAGCQACHGQDLSGGATGVACAQCHGAAWKTTCTMCHGGVANSTGAPPNSIWGTGDPSRGGGTPDPIRVGAHTAHVQGTLAASFDCGQCHVTPTDALSAGHIDGAYATVTFGELAVTGAKLPSYSRANGATCSSTYCHGGYSGTYTYTGWDWGLDEPTSVTVSYAGKSATPAWTDGSMTCGSCHDNPPRTGVWHSGSHGGGNQCQLCHPDAIGTTAGVGTAITNPALHVNGTVNVTPQWSSRCFGCH